jgi:hypothetical protein
MEALPMSIVLPDGSECVWASDGATIAFDGERLNYICSEPGEELTGDVVLLGDPIADGDTIWTMTRGVVARENDEFVLAESESVTFFLAQLDLADGSVCLHAGFGATAGVDDRRVNWTCGEGDPIPVVAGALDSGDAMPGVYMAYKAMLTGGEQGFRAESSEFVPVLRVTGETLP